MKENKTLPLFGVGPLYVGIIALLTLVGIVLSYFGFLNSGIIETKSIRIIFYVIGLFFIVAGIVIWFFSFYKIDPAIKSGELLTSGIFVIVRNPIYSAFMLLFTGILLLFHNSWLLILPVIFYIFLTVLMIHTEEKWLREKFGKEYDDYCKKVNRCVPSISCKLFKKNL